MPCLRNWEAYRKKAVKFDRLFTYLLLFYFAKSIPD